MCLRCEKCSAQGRNVLKVSNKRDLRFEVKDGTQVLLCRAECGLCPGVLVYLGGGRGNNPASASLLLDLVFLVFNSSFVVFNSLFVVCNSLLLVFISFLLVFHPLFLVLNSLKASPKCSHSPVGVLVSRGVSTAAN